MSTTTPNPSEETYECAHCGGPRRPSTSVAGSFCSIDCHQQHRREKRAGEVLRELAQDHRFCATCGRQLKEIEAGDQLLVVGPSRHDSWTFASDVWAGYQHRTEHAELGEISLDTADEPTVLTDDYVATGTVCECGNTDHRHEESAIRERFPFETAHYLALAVDILHVEGKHDVQVDWVALVNAVIEQALPVQKAAIDLRAALEAAVVLAD
jgi:DNA-directed RNA polymerase subunit RPC12/RpoP